MRGNVEAIKERLSVEEVLGGYLKLEKAGKNYKAKCPFHNEKTASFLVSPERQSYYCFGCGAKGDIFTFVEETEGLDFKEALKLLADRAGVKLEYDGGENKGEKDVLYKVLEEATKFFQEELEKNSDALKYLESRGVVDLSIKHWRLGFAPKEWRALKLHLNGLGFNDEVLTKAGLIKKSDEAQDKEAYDVFRDRIIFPMFDTKGEVIAFSGRAFDQEAMPKYLNSPDTPLFTKSEVLYGLDKAKDDIRKKDYAVLVEGQMDLVLSHQAGVKNTVASSGTAFTELHLARLKRLSPRIILAFDGDSAGKKAAEKSAALALSLGLEVKIATMPEGKDPADLVKESEESWKEVLRASKHAIEVLLSEVLGSEKDARKALKLVKQRVLPLVALIESSMERSHFVSLVARRTGIKEEIIWEDVKLMKRPASERVGVSADVAPVSPKRTRIEELDEVMSWLKEDPGDKDLLKHEAELRNLVRIDELDKEIAELRLELEGEPQSLAKMDVLTRERDEVKRRVL